ncbi:MAG TPA: ribosome small subunit-dependent GTPase A [Gemmatimonadaceae bacterium]|nr:ribosome small subunit-dependent GTPase A [Gemmatimonadaceae bacterium]
MTDVSRRGVVLSGTGGSWRVRVDDASLVDATLRGRLKREAPETPRRDGDGDRLKLAVGDLVLIEPGARGGAWAICEILPRRSRLARRAPGGAYGERIVAANVDQVVIVFAAAKPEPHTRMLDRFLVIAEANELAARIIVNKIDLVNDREVRERFAPYENAGYPVHFTSMKRGDGLADVRAMLDGRVSVFTGPSGVGKSSLLNALFPGLALRVGEISESVNKGRHTTVGASMIPLPDESGGYVVDTPGLREVGMWALSAEHLDMCFPELRPFVTRCRFADCTHTAEPNCAVKEAVERGDVSRERYASYLKLRDELEKAEFH